MSIWGKWVVNETIVGGTVLECSEEGMKVLGLDELEYHVRIEEGYSGHEFQIYETHSSIARRGAVTRRKRKESS